jgi:hypothetical protein
MIGRLCGRFERRRGMRFLISMTDVEGEWDGLPPDRQREILARHDAFKQALIEKGKFVDACHLYPRSEARTVRMDRSGEITEIAGPFSDAREHVGGFYIIDADSIEEATEWARRGRFIIGANEVRQIWE